METLSLSPENRQEATNLRICGPGLEPVEITRPVPPTPVGWSRSMWRCLAKTMLGCLYWAVGKMIPKDLDRSIRETKISY